MYDVAIMTHDAETYIIELEEKLSCEDEICRRLREKMLTESNPKNGRDYYYACLRRRKTIRTINEIVKYM